MFATLINGKMITVARFGLKMMLYLITITTALVIASIIYISINRDKIIENFVTSLKEEVSLEFKYSKIDLDLIRHFPLATISINNLQIDNPKVSNHKILLNTPKLSLTFNSINLIRGNFEIRSFIMENGVFNYSPTIIESIISSKSTKNKGKPTFKINKFILKNYTINTYSTNNVQSDKIKILKSIFYINLYNNEIEIKGKSELDNNCSILGAKIQEPICIKFLLTGNQDELTIEYLNINTKIVDVKSSGIFHIKKNRIDVKYDSQILDLKRLCIYLDKTIKIPDLSGKAKVRGDLNYDINNQHFLNLTATYESSLKVTHQGKQYQLKNLKGTSTFSDDFKKHNTTIYSVQILSNNIRADIKAKVKGTQNPIFVAEGSFDYKNSGATLLKRKSNIEVNGNLKVLFLLTANNSDDYCVKYNSLNGSVNFNISEIEGIDRINGLIGNAIIDKNINIKTLIEIDKNPIELNLNQRDIVELLNKKTSANPSVTVSTSESLDLDYLLGILNNSSLDRKDQQESLTEISIRAKELKYMNYSYKNVESKILITNNNIDIQSFSCNGFDGNIDGSIKIIDNKYFISSAFKEINISKLFNHYNNFKQNIVTHNNISGNLSGSAILNFTTNDKGEIDMPSIKMESDITISNGKLMGMNKIEKLSKWLKLDQVKSIDFKTLKNKIEISDGCVKIPKMDVLSNVINMQLSGEHYFNGNFTYWMKINLSQVLSRRFLNSSVSNDNEHSTDGSINLYLKLFGDNNNYEVKLDKKSSFENIRTNIQAEGKTLKEIFREEFNQITKKDTILKANKDSSLSNKTKFNIEWDEYDTLNVDNN